MRATGHAHLINYSANNDNCCAVISSLRNTLATNALLILMHFLVQT